METYDSRAAMVTLGRGIRWRGRMFLVWPAIPTPLFVWEDVGWAPESTEACAA